MSLWDAVNWKLSMCVLTSTSFQFRIDLNPLNWFVLLYCAWANFELLHWTSRHSWIFALGCRFFFFSFVFFFIVQQKKNEFITFIRNAHTTTITITIMITIEAIFLWMYTIYRNICTTIVAPRRTAFIHRTFVAITTHTYIQNPPLFCFVVLKYHSHSIHSIHLMYVFHLAKLFYRCKCYGILRNVTTKWTSFRANSIHTLTYSSCLFRPDHLLPLPWCSISFFLLLNVAVAVERSPERERRRCESVTYTYTYAESGKPSASSEWIQLYPVVLIHKPNWTICNLDFQWNGHRCGECASIDLIKNRTIVDVLANHCTNRINSCYNSFGFDMILIIIMI